MGASALALKSLYFKEEWRLRSVVRHLSSVSLPHPCPLLKPFDGFRRHLAGTFVLHGGS